MNNKLIGDENNNTKVEVRLLDEDVWLNVNAIADLFNVQRPAIVKHISNIYNDQELEKSSTCSILEQVQLEGNRRVSRKREYYNLDMIISIGFRVNSKTAIKFRTWANKLIKEYIVKGFNLNDDRFIKGNKFDKRYFDELLERIKTIRVSERMSYQKITDLFIATSTDYNSKSEDAYIFFKIVQNKLHYAITNHTAAELIYERANSEHINMGLTNWKNSPDGLIYKYDVGIAKNYLNKDELKKLNNLTNLFLNYAEDMAEEEKVMTMANWIEVTDKLLVFREKKILNNSGRISHKQAKEKAESEYEKFRIKQDREYISSMDQMYERYLKGEDIE